nr:MAG TPA: hypothetical protein [Bacteriophage sp.]
MSSRCYGYNISLKIEIVNTKITYFSENMN